VTFLLTLYAYTESTLIGVAALFGVWRWLTSLGPFSAEVYTTCAAVWGFFLPALLSGNVMVILLGALPAVYALTRAATWRFNRAAMTDGAR
jgi:hypothetical protein